MVCLWLLRNGLIEQWIKATENNENLIIYFPVVFSNTPFIAATQYRNENNGIYNSEIARELTSSYVKVRRVNNREYNAFLRGY